MYAVSRSISGLWEEYAHLALRSVEDLLLLEQPALAQRNWECRPGFPQQRHSWGPASQQACSG